MADPQIRSVEQWVDWWEAQWESYKPSGELERAWVESGKDLTPFLRSEDPAAYRMLLATNVVACQTIAASVTGLPQKLQIPATQPALWTMVGLLTLILWRVW
jgi:hypothetical protein